MANDSVVETFARLVEYIAKKFLRGEVTLADLLNPDDKETSDELRFVVVRVDRG